VVWLVESLMLIENEAYSCWPKAIRVCKGCDGMENLKSKKKPKKTNLIGTHSGSTQ
jgi:hypothetical protein